MGKREIWWVKERLRERQIQFETDLAGERRAGENRVSPRSTFVVFFFYARGNGYVYTADPDGP